MRKAPTGPERVPLGRLRGGPPGHKTAAPQSVALPAGSLAHQLSVRRFEPQPRLRKRDRLPRSDVMILRLRNTRR